jgi:hypothetical protein
MQSEPDHDICQLLLPFPGVNWPVAPTVAGTASVVLTDPRWRAWTHEPAAADLSWSEDELEEAA